MMIKLFATDLDGTLLLSKQPGCDEKIYNTLKQMIDKNYLMCFATGRNLREIEMEEYLWRLPAYVVSMNGAIILDQKHNLLKSYPFSYEVTKAICEEFANYPLEFLGMRDKWVQQDKESFEAYVLENIPDKFKQAINYEEIACTFFSKNIFNASSEEIALNKIYKIDFMCCDDSIEKIIRERLFHLFGKDMFHIAYDGMSIEITRKEADKGTALLYLSELLGIKKEEVAVFGDSGNDVTMLASFPHSYAMENAAEKAKESANHIIGNNNDYAVTAEMMKIINRDNK